MDTRSFVSVQKVYEKNKELKEDDIKLLQEWMNKQPHLPKATELELILFLHSCYYSVESTKTCIDTFYTCRTHCPEFFKNRNPLTDIPDALQIMLFTPLPKLTKMGYQIIYTTFLDGDSEKFVLSEQVKNFDMSTMLMLRQCGTAAGHFLLIDIKDITLSHLTKFNLMALKKFFFYLQEGMPIRLKAMYFINIPNFMDTFLSIIKPFMKKELLDTMKLYTNNWDELYKIIPKECFPADYGGESVSVRELTEKRDENFRANAKYFTDAEKDISDETKRAGKPRDVGDVFGMEGTFRKLDID